VSKRPADRRSPRASGGSFGPSSSAACDRALTLAKPTESRRPCGSATSHATGAITFHGNLHLEPKDDDGDPAEREKGGKKKSDLKAVDGPT